jgi:hypothetical protein
MQEGAGKPLVRSIRRWGDRGGLATTASFGRQWRAVRSSPELGFCSGK